MPLVSGKELIKHALEGKYAIPAFGIVNLEGAIAAIEAATETNSPVIIQTTQGGIEYAGHAQLAAIVISLAKDATIPVALHLDHGRDTKYHQKAIELGYTSLMIDGSPLSFDENVKITNQVIAMVRENNLNLSIEAELGKIGGKEDDVEDEGSTYTSVEDAINFIKQTNGGVDMLAIACGTSHGFYTKEPHINQELIKEVYAQTNVPLVLHGGTGVPLEQITEAVGNGVVKVNIDSELKQGIIKGVMDYMEKHPEAYDLRKINRQGIDYAKAIAISKIKAVKAVDKNWL
ncbi:MAG: fructose-bisphosphate aldolase [Candidatus Tyloplasma litorale]|nr:MAG: fructose-bisphosphate aldolase [Mycoplasmatales bacterium]